MKRNLFDGGGLAGAILIAVPSLDVAGSGGNVGMAHAAVVLCGLAMLAAAVAGRAGKEG